MSLSESVTHWRYAGMNRPVRAKQKLYLTRKVLPMENKYLMVVDPSDTTWNDTRAKLLHRKQLKMGVGLNMCSIATSLGFPNIGSPMTLASMAALSVHLPEEKTQFIVNAHYGFDEVLALGIIDYRRLLRKKPGDNVGLLSSNRRVEELLTLLQKENFDRDREPMTLPERLQYMAIEHTYPLDQLISYVLYYFDRGSYSSQEWCPRHRGTDKSHRTPAPVVA